jgi:hypothetical protein
MSKQQRDAIDAALQAAPFDPSQGGDGNADGAHPVLVVHVPAR